MFTPIIKIIGLCLLSSGITVFGINKSAQLNMAVKKRKAVEELLFAIENGIRYGSIEKKRIYRSFENDILNECGFLEQLKNGKDEKECITLYLTELDKADQNALISFFESFGKSSSAEKEFNLCKSFIEEYKRIGTEKEKALISKSILYKKLGLICALMSVILLI